MADKQMKAVHYEGPFKVSVKDVPLPKVEHPDDAIIKVTTAGRSIPSLKDNFIVSHSSRPSIDTSRTDLN
jgi:hypothetical protein